MAQAERLYRAILQAQPDQPDANHNLGVLECQRGRPLAALPHLKMATAVHPGQGQYALSYAAALLATGHADDALNAIDAAIGRGLNTAEAGELRRQAAFAIESRSRDANRSQATSGKSAKKVKATGHLPSRKAKLSQAEIDRIASLFNSGRYIELESWARVLVERSPDSGIAWKALGLSLGAQGKNPVPASRKAAKLLPDDVQVHSNLGKALTALGEWDEAVASCRRALQIDPADASAHFYLGNALHGRGQLDDAAASYGRALKFRPQYFEAANNLANALKDLGQFADALMNFERSLEIKPDSAEVWTNKGLLLGELKRFDEALACHDKAICLDQNLAQAWSNKGLVLQDLKGFDDALACYDKALQLDAGFAGAWLNKGITLNELGRSDDALPCLENAVRSKPDYAPAYLGRGDVLLSLWQIDGALTNYRHATDLMHDSGDALNKLVFNLNYLPGHSAANSFAEARRFGELLARKAKPYAHWSNVPDPTRRLRIGLVSGDFRQHAVGYFLQSVLAAAHASDNLEFFAYSTHFRSDALTERFMTYCQGWRLATGLSDESLARLVRSDGIDILIDLSGHTQHNRLAMFAWKPAPVQVSWLGYFATTGIAAIDYLIADPHTLPESDEGNFIEEIWRLPETRLCFTPPDIDVAVSPLPALTNGFITFGCFNNMAKVNDTVVTAWARILNSVPDSRLFLKNTQIGQVSVRERIVDRFADHGIDKERLILEGRSPRAEYLDAYQRVDIALDPFPYPGGTTTVEGLWMGVPALTLAGERFISRQGVGFLMNMGMDAWIAADADDYVARATSHAADVQALASLRGRLREQLMISPVCDAARFARHFETALRGMWARWCTSGNGA